MSKSVPATQLFEVGTSPLESGVTLIEASAGTGKTYAIAGMVVRLIAERKLSIREILIVTYTEAATAELRERVRSRIRDAISFLENGSPKKEKDPALRAFEKGDGDRSEAVRALRNALLTFDEAAIFTIHGFCQRMLRENAFETGALFEVELVTDPVPIWRQTVEDFWRKTFYTDDLEIGLAAAWLQKEKRLSTERLVEILAAMSNHPELQILVDKGGRSLEEWRAQFESCFFAIRGSWRQNHGQIEKLLREFRSFNKPYAPAALDEIFDALQLLLTEKPASLELISFLLKLTPEQLQEGTRKNKTAPHDPFFDQCLQLQELFDDFVRIIQLKFIDYARSELPAQKRRKNILTFDDLLNRLYQALQGEEAEKLEQAIGQKFQAALIDEFQDTDPVQWEIFRRIFGRGEHLLFLIGDPKQAIYGFRGADIFTYIAARDSVPEERRYTLGTNWRSDSELVEAANTLFAQHQAPFVNEEIVFQPVAAARSEKDGAKSELDFGESGISEKPLQLVCVSGNSGKVAVEQARKTILDLMAAEICRLLTSGITRDGEPLKPSDIAILTMKNWEAAEVRERLMEEKIPAVIRTSSSVLQTEEAEEVRRILTAILEPHRDALLRGAMATRFFGWKAESVFESVIDENRWEEIVEQFHEWQRIWLQSGFMRMFRPLLQKQKTALLGLRDGERIVTNFQHVAECLHQAEHESRLSPTMLVRWLSEQKQDPDSGSDHHVIRLEKDEKAVQIVTVHRSKGLEYPIVFCPFNWTNYMNSKDQIIFHDPSKGNRLTWDLNALSDDFKKLFEAEKTAEAMRLLYVAVTRARNRCYLFWADTRDSLKPENNVLAHLFECGSKAGRETPEAAFNCLGEASTHEVCYLEPPALPTRYQPLEERERLLEARRFSKSIPQTRLITSFSGMTAGAAHDFLPDRDALAENLLVPDLEEDTEDAATIFNFPKGANAGNFFHSLLEKLDFQDPETLPGLIESHLNRFRFDRRFQPALLEKLRELLDLPLFEDVKLAEIPKQDRLIECPFYFPIRPVTSRQLSAVFEEGDLPAEYLENLGRLEFHPVDGYMTGFIDLLFRVNGRYFIIDWKSNWLGGSLRSYRGEQLQKAMSGSYYFLQYHLYALALHRHLAMTLPDYKSEEHFGGVFYLFLRGITSEDPTSGVFYDRPSKKLLEKLEEILIPSKGVLR